MAKENLSLGKCGEEAALRFLKENGYRILEVNLKTKFGEIDIVASEKDTLVFIEVKARSSNRFGLPQEAVSAFKQRQIAKSAIAFLKGRKLLDRKARFDVVSVSYCGLPAPRIDLIKNAFELGGEFTL